MTSAYLQQLQQTTIASGSYLIPISDPGSGRLMNIPVTNLLNGFVVANTSVIFNNITALGVYSGTWQGNNIGVGFGGTGGNSFTPYGVVIGGTTNTGALQSTSVGSSGQVLSSNGPSNPPSFKTIQKVVTCIIDGNGTQPTPGFYGYTIFPFAGTIVGVRMFGDVAGSAVVDVWKAPFGNTAPAIANTITASDIPTLNSALTMQDNTLTGWTTAISANDMIGFNLNSVTTCTKVTLELLINQS